MKQFLVFLIGLVTLVGATPRLEQCARNPAVRLDVSKFPDVLELKTGEKLTFAFRITVLEDLQEPIYAKIQLKRKAWFVWVPLPCVNNVGSCEYKLTCDKIREWSKLDKLPHPCPAPAGVTDRQFTISIPKIPGVLKAIGSGTYFVKVSLHTGQKGSGRNLGCAETKIQVQM